MKKLVVVIDFQKDFVDPQGALYVPESEKLAEGMEQYLCDRLTTKQVEGLLFTQDTHYLKSYENSEEAKQFPVHCLRDTWGWDLHPVCIDQGVVVDEYGGGKCPTVFYLEKSTFNMWENPRDVGLLPPYNIPTIVSSVKMLTDFNRDVFFDLLQNQLGINTIEICGVASDYCVRYAIQGFLERGFNVEIVENLCKGINKEIREVVKEENWEDKVKFI